MSNPGSVVIVGGTRAIGLELVRHYAGLGRDVVLSGQSSENVAAAVADVGGSVRGITFDLAEPESIEAALADVGPVDRLALVAIDRDQNSIADYSIERAIRLVTLKLVGYTTVVSTLRSRLSDSSSVVLFGGMAKERPYPGSTTVTTVNGGVVGLTRTLVEELRPIRVNSIHPASSATARTGPRSRRRSPATPRRRRSGASPRWTRSWTRPCSCSRTGRSTAWS